MLCVCVLVSLYVLTVFEGVCIRVIFWFFSHSVNLGSIGQDDDMAMEDSQSLGEEDNEEEMEDHDGLVCRSSAMDISPGNAYSLTTIS